MAENREKKTATGETYELDVDWEQKESLEDVFEQAMAAVDRDEETVRSHGALDETDSIMLEEALEEAVPDEAEATPPPIVDEATLRIQRLEKENEGLRDRLMRTLADFENYRKRTEREKETTRRFGLADVLKEFLGVADNLERALAASGNADDLKTGVEMIHRQLGDLLRRQGVEEVEAVGQPFDPKVHEAVLRMDRDDVDQPTVIQEMQKGFTLHDRLLRPAMVTVAMPTAPSRPATATAGEDDREGAVSEPGTEAAGSEEGNGSANAPVAEEEVVARSAEAAD